MELVKNKINELPDDVLISVLELMNSRSAVATSALSRRWRHLWKSLTKFNFDVRDVLHPLYHRLRKSLFGPNRRLLNSRSNRLLEARLDRNSTKQFHKKYKRQAMRVFLKSVNHFLSLDDCSNVRSFRLSLFMIEKYAHLIDLCVSTAANRRNMDDLEVKILGEVSSKKKSYNFPISMLSDGGGSFLTKLSLSGCELQIPSGFYGFDSLTRLSLLGVHMNDEHIDNLLNSCRHLGNLCLERCTGFDLLIISSSLSTLKDLEVCDCSMRKIQIYSSKLESLSYTGYLPPLVFEYAPRLKRLELCYFDILEGTEYMLGKLSTDHPNITTLDLWFEIPRHQIKPKHLPAPFSKLNQLFLVVDTNATADLLWMSLLLEAAPVLKILRIAVKKDLKEGRRFAGIQWEPSDFRHCHLNMVTMYCYRGTPNEVAFARFLLDRAVFLKSIDLISELWCKKNSMFAESCQQTSPWNEKERDELLKQLTDGISTSARIVTR